jgi:hypothetical protein
MSRGILFLANVFLSDCTELIEENLIDTIYTEENTVVTESTVADKTDVQLNAFEEEEQFEELNTFDTLDEIKKNGNCKDEEDNNIDLYGEVSQEYDSQLLWFYNPEQWTKSTNCLCWWCGLPCQEVPWFIPLTKTKKLVPDGTIREINEHLDCNDGALISSSKKCKEISVMKPYGIFCTPWCAAAKLNREINPRITNKWQSMALLIEVYKMYHNKQVHTIPEAYYPKEIMIQYCGSKNGVNPTTYRQMNHKKAMEALN